MTQLGFDDLLAEAETTNDARRFEAKTAHLPEEDAEAIAHFRRLIGRHDRAMRAADVREVRVLRDEATFLAQKMNGGAPGILAHDDAPGYRLQRATAAPEGHVPFWGQTGSFTVEIAGIPVRVEMSGLLGLGNSHAFWPGFEIHAVEPEKPFLSDTGYRSFLGIYTAPQKGLGPDGFVSTILNGFLRNQLKGKPVAIRPISSR